MIGYYAHHHGAGHVNRAMTLAPWLPEFTLLSSAAPPDSWDGDWVELARDDTGVAEDPTAHGLLHWVPRHDRGLSARMATISAWIERARPELMIVDVSVEVCLLARLHGIPVIAVAQPGIRDDVPHSMAYRIADRVVAPWPASAGDLLPGVAHGDRLVHVGAFSRFDDRVPPPGPETRRVALLLGRGGHDVPEEAVDRARASTPDWEWSLAGSSAASWVEDPWTRLVDADVIVTHAGQNALAEVAAARRPVIMVPQDRPHDEQRTMAATLREGGRWPVVSLDGFPSHGWPALLDLASGLDGERWKDWNDGGGARRFAQVVCEVLRR
ncbi:hypothetical protein BHE97_17320 [Aeromicrobium sp. PE09-221]|uniref:glycosyltransferase n=1 Tax=Aeromicrobium sp. PE09-221 TaxID=1898043 RepID=UPI000B3E783A|nr:glycosyltransferase [Aeromicrobium sp. PE09-221]OUZ07264.1 hypothetical protein BHE97_17320 [Aeromicrobium sp. PE09-221]